MTDAPRHPAGPRKKVALRNEARGEDYRFLWAYLDEQQNLHIDGQDGPGTAIVSSDSGGSLTDAGDAGQAAASPTSEDAV